MPTKESSLKLIQSYYDAFNYKDWNSFFELLDNDVIHDINQSDREIGKDLFQKFMENMKKYYDESIKDVVIMSNEDGTRLAAEYVVTGHYTTSAPSLPKAKGQNYSLPGGAFFEVRKNKITRVTNYYNVTHWINLVKE